MHILAIDPGTTESGYVIYEPAFPLGKVLGKGTIPNDGVLHLIDGFCLSARMAGAPSCEVVIEMIASYGMSVGETTFETVVWIGRFEERTRHGDVRVYRLKRLPVKMHMCKSPKADDSAIRQRIIDLYGPGKERAIGNKRAPGPLYGLTGDAVQALALAITHDETRDGPDRAPPLVG